MSVENLLKIKQLQLHDATDDALLRLMDAIKRNIEDSQVKAVSECIKQAGYLFNHLETWIKANRKELGI